MQGLITLDFGNSNPHAGIFQKHTDWQLVKVVPVSELNLYLSQLQMSAHNTSVVLCEVKSREDEIQKLQEQGFLVTRVKDYWRGSKFAGMPVNYTKTLGEDRLIVAWYQFKKIKSTSLIIDAGTFVTMDVVDGNGFQGGYIIPGMKAYFESYGHGEQLKDVSPLSQFSGKLPNETATAITESYTAFGALARKLLQDYQLKNIILTGGQSGTWESFLTDSKDAIVVERHPHLIHSALQYWMTTQIEPL